MNKFFVCTFVIVIFSLIDQLSKTYIISFLKTQPNFIFEVTPFLDFVYSWNYGISFGLFAQYHGYSNYILLALNICIVIYMIYLLINTNKPLRELATGGQVQEVYGVQNRSVLNVREDQGTAAMTPLPSEVEFPKRSNGKLYIYGLILIIGGAIGNLVDRILRGAVFDFIYFNYQDFSFPAFNIADSFISIGAILFLYDHFFQKKPLAEN